MQFEPFSHGMSHVVPVYGIPGSGKTTYLLDVIDKLLTRGVQPYEIAFVTFTNAARDEALERVMKRFDISRRELRNFSTIHSLSGIPTGKRLRTNKDYKEVGKITGLEVTMDYNRSGTSETNTGGKGRGDICIETIGYAAAKEVTLKEACFEEDRTEEMHRKRMSLDDVMRFAEALEEYKRKEAIVDFNDMLVAGKEAEPIAVKYAIIDEAQDLSLAQWRSVDNLFQHAEAVYIAGDDDQAIFDFTGGCSEVFRAMGARFPKSLVVLDHSHRCPALILEAAQGPLEELTDRVEKIATPREEEGVLKPVSGLKYINFEEGDWLILVRQHSHAQKVYDELIARGLMFTRTRGGASVSNSIKKAIETHTALSNGKEVSPMAAIQYYGMLKGKTHIKHGFKGSIEKKLASRPRAKKKPIDRRTLEEDFGLLPHVCDEPWFDALIMIPEKERFYVRYMLKREKKFSDSKIRVLTIHGAKGTECDNVVIMPEISYRQVSKMKHRDETEYRVAYVAMTRARQALYLVQEMGIRFSFTEYNRYFKKVLDEHQSRDI